MSMSRMPPAGLRLIHDTIEPRWVDDLRSDAVSLTEQPTEHSVAGADDAVAKVSDGASRAIQRRGGPRFQAVEVQAMRLGNGRKRDKCCEASSGCKRYAL
jgi:hypothetical protein